MIAAEAFRTGLLGGTPPGPALAAFLGDFLEGSALTDDLGNAVKGRAAVLGLLGPLACPKDRSDSEALAGLYPFSGLDADVMDGVLFASAEGLPSADPILSFCA